MNLETMAGRWKRVQGAVLCRWGRLTADSYTVFVGEQYSISGRIQELLGRLRASGRRRRRSRAR
jgi:uncharacterized protein YjbJ (UPF0337 family)